MCAAQQRRVMLQGLCILIIGPWRWLGLWVPLYKTGAGQDAYIHIPANSRDVQWVFVSWLAWCNMPGMQATATLHAWHMALFGGTLGLVVDAAMNCRAAVGSGRTTVCLIVTVCPRVSHWPCGSAWRWWLLAWSGCSPVV